MHPVRLLDVPQQFLDPEKWQRLLAFAPQNNKLLALTYLNAPYPDPRANGCDVFWNIGTGCKSFEECLPIYQAGRDLLSQSRSLLSKGVLMATAISDDNEQTAIPADFWIDFYPMFATERVVGRGRQFTNVRVTKATMMVTATEVSLKNCKTWLTAQKALGNGAKKATLKCQAELELAQSITHATFNAAYATVFQRRRGRPHKSLILGGN